jgi:hypothetical protein
VSGMVALLDPAPEKKKEYGIPVNQMPLML